MRDVLHWLPYTQRMVYRIFYVTNCSLINLIDSNAGSGVGLLDHLNTIFTKTNKHYYIFNACINFVDVEEEGSFVYLISN